MTGITRRRALFIGAAAAATGLAPAARAPEARWHGQALGAHAEIRFRHLSQAEARPLFAAIEIELARLEGIFSLYRTDSALARLNRDGVLEMPPPELVELLGLARGVHAGSDGLFDPTVQPLFDLYAKAATGGQPVVPEALHDGLARVGMDRVSVTGSVIRLGRPGMALTLNGIAQGHVTDRIAALLKAHGLTDVIVDIGEILATGTAGDGPGWAVRIAGVQGKRRLCDRGLATSAPLGTPLDRAGRIGHILHPARGWVAPVQRQVSVLADSAALADALSTAAALMPDRQLATLRARGFEVVALPV
ncbi:FAD:protein FMN transferase [Frigidibacter sp. ROC022]|uniref:FAD:protein FMN transferase n=1 Tax=Frigidibacter sp. ROC022 TaxID=2971796 RepID=UPI00215A56C8|nr:FAD:protein FMN transferase [Frigidibacter sp. ROC022]MCR8726116.1 FAD:protein FMN transferase [Frigidibacter sp. ROC022]